MRQILLTINKEPYEVFVKPSDSLLRVIRDKVGLKGTKNGCNVGECGACTVLIDGDAVRSCLTLAVAAKGKQITTIEGMTEGQVLHPLQDKFIEYGAIQCGFCTPGMIIAAGAFLREEPNPSEDEVREAMAGNLCRCTGYTKIVDAIKAAAEDIK
jgi:carbon-monoxide dehydrogenase small subunit